MLNSKIIMNQQVHVFFIGTVQGVGFRYTALMYAQQLDLAGWVRNLPDGSVEAMAEGPKDKLQQFVSKLDSHFDGYIREKKVNYREASGSFREFKITH